MGCFVCTYCFCFDLFGRLVWMSLRLNVLTCLVCVYCGNVFIGCCTAFCGFWVDGVCRFRCGFVVCWLVSVVLVGLFACLVWLCWLRLFLSGVVVVVGFVVWDAVLMCCYLFGGLLWLTCWFVLMICLMFVVDWWFGCVLVVFVVLFCLGCLFYSCVLLFVVYCFMLCIGVYCY